MSKFEPLLKFKPAKLSAGKDVFVSYWAWNQEKGKLDIKKIKLNHIANEKERLRYANRMIKEINKRLYADWNPFDTVKNKRGNDILFDALDVFIAKKKSELREDSMRSYRIYVTTMKNYLVATSNRKMRCCDFAASNARDFLDRIYLDRDIKGRTFNNYKLFFSTLWNWLIEYEYFSENYFAKIKKKVVTEKERILIDEESRALIKDWLLKKDYNYMIVTMLVFHALIRPKEICWLKPCNFDLKNQVIRVPASAAKARKMRLSTIPDTLLKHLEEWDFNGAAANEFIFSVNMLPGRIPINPRRMTKKWDKLRDDLALEKEMKLYSLRDSGIVQMLRDGVSPEEVMKQAGHTSLETTTIYLKYANPTGSHQIKQKCSRFEGAPRILNLIA